MFLYEDYHQFQVSTFSQKKQNQQYNFQWVLACGILFHNNVYLLTWIKVFFQLQFALFLAL